MNILYCPILETGAMHERAVQYKRGLYTALVKAGHRVIEYDYLDHLPSGQIYGDLNQLFKIFQPDLFLSQLHGADCVMSYMVRQFRENYPQTQWINWSGDSHRHSLLGQPMIELMQRFDWLLVPTLDVLPELEAAGVQAAYWNIAYEPIFEPFPEMPTYDIVYQANAYTEERKALMRFLQTLPYKVGIYGDWEQADGNTTYNFPAQQALYKQATIAIADNTRVDDLNYVSDRPMTIMASGGAICLHQRVNRMEELTGWRSGVHYVEWTDLDDLRKQIDYWMDKTRVVPHTKIVTAAQEQVLRHHSFTARVRELFEKWVIEP